MSGKPVLPGVGPYIAGMCEAMFLPAVRDDGGNPYAEACADLNRQWQAMPKRAQTQANRILRAFVKEPESFTGPNREDDLLKATVDAMVRESNDTDKWHSAVPCRWSRRIA
jgi:hypothetical protein